MCIAKVTHVARSCDQLYQQFCQKANGNQCHVSLAICYYYDHELTILNGHLCGFYNRALG